MIPMPTICRQVIVSRKDGHLFPFGGSGQSPVLVRAMPATIIGLEDSETLAVLLLVGSDWYRAQHRDLATGNWPNDSFVWEWPPLRLEGIQSKT